MQIWRMNLWRKTCGRDKLVIGCIYRSPNNTEENNDMLFTLIKRNAARKEFTHQLITGDVNAICWETWSTSSSN